MKRNKGITLIALVITIVVLIILAGVAISLTLGENGILKKAENAREEYQMAQAKEKLELEILETQTEIMESEGRNATLEDLFRIIDTSKYEIVLKYEPIATTETVQSKATYAEVMDIESKIIFIVDDELVIREVTIQDGEEEKEIIINKIDMKIGTSYVNIIVDAKSKTEKDLTYKYIMDGEEITELMQNEYKIENLAAESTHNIKIIVTDGNEEITYTKTIITKPRVYLYNYGDEKEAITGGYTTITGEDNIVVNKENDCITVTGNKANSWGFICSNEKIDMKNFTKIKVEIEDNGNTSGSNFGIFDIANNIEDSYAAGIEVINGWPIGSTGTPKTEKEIDIEDIEEEVYIRIGAYGYGKWMRIYSIWLEE